MSTIVSVGFAVLVSNTLIGMVANGFIVLFGCVNWFRSRKLSPTDLILCSLGLSRFLWHMIVIVNSVMISFFKRSFFQNYTCISTLWLFMNTVNLWFSAWLSVLYFVKIAIFSHPVFLQMKQRISGLVPWLLLGSVVFCAAVTVIIITVSTHFFTICHPYQPASTNRSDSAIQNLNFCRYFPILYLSPNIIPFMLFLSSTIFLISSLWKHIQCLQSSGIGVKDLSTQVHLTAIKSLVSFAVLYLFSFVAIILQLANPFERRGIDSVFENVSALYPSGHTIILIWINPKLKEAWVRMLHHFKCHLSETPP